MPCRWVHMVTRNLAGTRASTQRLELTIWWYSCHLDPSTPQQTKYADSTKSLSVGGKHCRILKYLRVQFVPSCVQSVGFLVICLNFNEHQSVCLIGRITHLRLSLSPVRSLLSFLILCLQNKASNAFHACEGSTAAVVVEAVSADVLEVWEALLTLQRHPVVLKMSEEWHFVPVTFLHTLQPSYFLDECCC